MDAFIFWMTLPLAALAWLVGLFLVFLCIYGVVSIPSYLRSKRCSHEQVHERPNCDAVCMECGKNLGFIKNWRDAQKAKGAA